MSKKNQKKRIARIFRTYEDPIFEDHINILSQYLNEGQLIACPTELDWVIGGLATQHDLQNRLSSLALDPTHDPLYTLLCSDLAMITQFATVSQVNFRVLRKYLPGPFTFILPANKHAQKQLWAKHATVAVRLPSRPILFALLESLQSPLITIPIAIANDRFDIDPVADLQKKYENHLDWILDLQVDLPKDGPTIVSLVDEGRPQIIQSGHGVFEHS